jgi:hypothetical protein
MGQNGSCQCGPRTDIEHVKQSDEHNNDHMYDDENEDYEGDEDEEGILPQSHSFNHIIISYHIISYCHIMACLMLCWCCRTVSHTI